jgi:cellulose synthase/poly-beta-1,6-N-acetylglucosamine synthase-like glycosyltransferase
MYLEVGYWICIGLVAYIYVGYPACVFLLSAVCGRSPDQSPFEPTVTVVISAYNEEAEIEATVMNKLNQDYPLNRLKVLVVSDGSTDRTDEIVKSLMNVYADRLMFLRQEPRQGKTQALNMAFQHLSSEVVVFADANSIYASNSIRVLVSNFSDPSVGYVTGQMVYGNPTATGIGAGSESYMSYENTLRMWESELGSIVGVDGGIDAIRRQCYIPMRPDQLPDFILPLNVVEQGYRVVYEPRAKVFERALSDPFQEFRMRVRVSLRAMWGLYDKRHLLNPFRFPLFAWQLMSHKVLRYGAFLPLTGLLLFNILTVSQGAFYAWSLAVQVAVYAVAMLGHFLRQSSGMESKLLSPYYFVILNVACILAFWKFLTGQKMVLWKPRLGG